MRSPAALLGLALALLFSQPYAPDFSHHECLAQARRMEPGLCADGSPCPEISALEPAPCDVVASATPGFEYGMRTLQPAVDGEVLIFCVAAVDYSGNESECVASDPEDPPPAPTLDLEAP